MKNDVQTPSNKNYEDIKLCLCGVMVHILDFDARDRGSNPTNTIRFMTYMAQPGY